MTQHSRDSVISAKDVPTVFRAMSTPMTEFRRTPSTARGAISLASREQPGRVRLELPEPPARVVPRDTA